jgi:hypothetical protein
MPQGPNDSPIKVTPEMEAALAECFSAEDIKKVFRDAMLEQNLVEADPFDPSMLHPREEAAPATRFGAKITINGKTHVAEGSSQAEADAKIAEIIRAATHPTTRDDQGRFTADQGRRDEAAAKAAADGAVAAAELELKFKRGEITTADYLEQSGAMEQFFAKKGINLSDVEESAQKAAGERITQSWQEATTEFLNSAGGSDWPGGEENKAQLSKILVEMNATEYPNAENLRRAYAYMKENNMVKANPELERDRLIREATTPEEIAAALHGDKLKKAGSSSTWTTRTWNGHG